MRNLLALTLALAIPGFSQASVIRADYPFPVPPATPAASVDTDLETTAEDYDARSALFPGGSSGVSNSSSTAYFRGNASNSTTEAAAVAAGDYHTFTLKVDGLSGSGNSLNLNSVKYDYRADQPYQFNSFLRSSADNFTTTLASGTPTSTINADLSGVAGGLTDQNVEFRIYFYDGSASDTRIHRIDNVELSGTTLSNLARYEFAGGSAASGDVESLTTATNYTTQVGTISPSSGTAYVESHLTTNSQSGAISGNDYHSFTLQMNGNAADLGVLAYDYQITESYNGLNWTSFVRSSADNFQSNLATNTFVGIGNGVDTDKVRVVADLSGAVHQSAIDDVEFRIYFYDDSSGNTRRHRVSDVIVNGDVRTDVLAAYGFTDTSPASTDTEMLTTAMDWSPQAGGVSANQDNAFVRSSETGSTESAALAGNDYQSSKLLIPDGYGVDLDAVVYDYYIEDPYATYQWTSFLRSSADGFTSNLASYTFSPTTTGGFTNTVQVFADLSGVEWNAITEDLEFRIYFYDDSSGSTRIHRIDNFVLYGAVIPEPTTLLIWSLLAGLGIGLGWRRRK